MGRRRGPRALAVRSRQHSACSPGPREQRAAACSRPSHGCAQPSSLVGEAYHLLASKSEPLYWLGLAAAADNDPEEARRLWESGGRSSTDFQQMAVAEISANTFWVAACLDALGEHEAAAALFHRIDEFAQQLEHQRPAVDYFATSLPTMLLFDDDLVLRNRIQSLLLRAQAALGLHRSEEAEALARKVLTLDPSHTGAADLLEYLTQQAALSALGGQ